MNMDLYDKVLNELLNNKFINYWVDYSELSGLGFKPDTDKCEGWAILLDTSGYYLKVYVKKTLKIFGEKIRFADYEEIQWLNDNELITKLKEYLTNFTEDYKIKQIELEKKILMKEFA